MHYRKSFARIFFRNAINIGVALLECPDTDKIDETDHIEVDFVTGVITNTTKKETYPGNAASGFR